MKRRVYSLLSATVFAVLVASGCGNVQNSSASNSSSNTTSTSTTSQRTMIVGGSQYSGKDKLQQFEKAADAHPKDAQAQIQAGISAFVNQDYQTAIQYYERAISADPKNVIAYNNLGNVYFRGLHDPKQALTYYQKATQVNPKYAYGWLNLALCEEQLGNKQAARDTVKQALHEVPSSDKLYSTLKQLQNQL